MGRLGKDRSVRQSRHSIAGANRASPPEAGVPNANHGYDAKLSSPKTGRAAGFGFATAPPHKARLDRVVTLSAIWFWTSKTSVTTPSNLPAREAIVATIVIS